MEKQTVFIKRYPSKKELPKAEQHVIVFWNDEPLSSRMAYMAENGYWFLSDYECDCDAPDHWLEEIELPSEEEIYSESFKSDNTPRDFIKGANFILNRLNQM